MKKKHPKECTCPFCEAELKMRCVAPDFCVSCDVEFVTCKKCGHKYREQLDKCPACGKAR